MAILQIRRGNSGSKGTLEYGEPYFNSNLQTVQWGGYGGSEITLVRIPGNNSGSLTIIGTVTATSFSGSFTGSLNGTASHALTASYVEFNNVANKPSLFSGSSQVQLDGISGTTFANASFTFPQNLVVEGDLTAKQLIISSSVIYITASFSSGSTVFGNSGDDTHQFTGSVQITGSLSVNGGITGSLFGTSSWSTNSITASYALTSLLTASNGLTLTGSAIELGGLLQKDTNLYGVKDGTLFSTVYNLTAYGFRGGDSVVSVVSGSGKIYYGGTFTEFSGSTQFWTASGLIRLDENNLKDEAFNVGSGFSPADVRSIALDSQGKLYVGGGFTSYNGTVANRIVKLNSDGTIDTSFNYGNGFQNVLNSSVKVYSIRIDGNGKLIVGGDFTSYSGSVGNNGIIRLNTDGTIDNSFNNSTGFNSNVTTIFVGSGNKYYVGGEFTTYKSLPNIRLIRINNDGTDDTTFETGTGLDASPTDIRTDSEGKLIVVGGFSNYSGSSSPGIVKTSLYGDIYGGFVVGSGFSPLTNVTASIWIDSIDRVYVVGNYLSYKGVTKNGIFRIDENGNLQNNFYSGNGFRFVDSLGDFGPVDTEYTARVTTITPSEDGDYLYVGGSGNRYDGLKFARGNAKLNLGENRLVFTKTVLSYASNYHTYFTSHSLVDKLYVDLATSGSLTGSLLGTASYASYVLNAATASYVLPLQQNVIITGSLFVSGGIEVSYLSASQIHLGNSQSSSLYTSVKVVTNNIGSNIIYQSLPTASYNGAFFDYLISSESNYRTGQIFAVVGGNDINYTETSTAEFGSTNGVKLGVVILGENMALTGSFTTNNWLVKSAIRAI